ncbi:MAG: RNA polymerase sigma factor RpoH [Deltaproteobacteria bacterium]|jgi:RNA polymerase sigma-32 factor|nr:RNA polymerase sigma factor RpoH [Deltaproteobacteria bacterium]MBW2475844.1 RNA polymerase sigma factor RpoH [Deltaproteobacteria bacterium]
MSSNSIPALTDTLEHYMAQINRFELLSQKEEYDLARRYRQTGDLDAAHRLICANLRFVVKVAYEYRGYGLRLLDLIQEGNIGLMLAVKKFDPDRGSRLITYAVWWIRAYIQNFIVRSWSLVKIGTTQAQKKLFFKLAQTRNAIRSLTGNDQLDEVAEVLEIDEKVVTEMSQRLSSRDVSLNMELSEGEDHTLQDSLADERENQEQLIEERQAHQLMTHQTRSALSQLSSRERRIVEQRILADEPKTLQELADEYAISRERVRQIEQNALRKLKPLLIQP